MEQHTVSQSLTITISVTTTADQGLQTLKLIELIIITIIRYFGESSLTDIDSESEEISFLHRTIIQADDNYTALYLHIRIPVESINNRNLLERKGSNWKRIHTYAVNT